MDSGVLVCSGWFCWVLMNSRVSFCEFWWALVGSDGLGKVLMSFGAFWWVLAGPRGLGSPWKSQMDGDAIL